MRSSRLLLALLAALSLSPRSARAECASDNDCKLGRVCQAGSCAERSCTKDAECPGEAICEASRCQLRGVPAAARPATPLERRETNLPLAIAGAIVWGGTFLAGIPVTAAIGDNEKATGLMAVPLMGPFLVAALEPITNEQGVALGAAAVFQAVGLTMFIIGLATERTVVDAPGSIALGAGPSAPVLSLAPTGLSLRY